MSDEQGTGSCGAVDGGGVVCFGGFVTFPVVAEGAVVCGGSVGVSVVSAGAVVPGDVPVSGVISSVGTGSVPVDAGLSAALSSGRCGVSAGEDDADSDDVPEEDCLPVLQAERNRAAARISGIMRFDFMACPFI